MNRVLIKTALVLVMLVVANALVIAQNKTQAYYVDHEKEILIDAQKAFSSGEYKLAVKLCKWHYIIVGDKKADALKQKASKCVDLISEMNNLASDGQLDEAREKAKELMEINPASDVDLSQFEPKITQLEFKKKYYHLPKDDIETLQLETIPKRSFSRESIIWHSSNPEVVSVDKYGSIITHRTGEAIITATLDELSTACQIAVVDLELTDKKIQFYVGTKSTLSVRSPIDNLEWHVEDPTLLDIAIFDDRVELCAKQEGATVVVASKGRNKVECVIEIENEQLEMVDMGLPSGVKWASRNYGASFKTNVGECVDEETVNSFGDQSKLGRFWTVPNNNDYKELKENSDVEFIRKNDVSGMLFTSKINGNRLFFPLLTYDWGAYWAYCGNNFGLGGIDITIDEANYLGGDVLLPVRAINIEGASLQVLDLVPRNTDMNLNVLKMSVYASDIKYLAPELRIFSRVKQSVLFKVRIIRPDGTVESNDDYSPAGYTYACKKDVDSGYSSLLLDGWGSSVGGSYKDGDYVIQIWNEDNCLYTRNIRLWKGINLALGDADIKPNENNIHLEEHVTLGVEIQDYVEEVKEEVVEEETIPFQLVEEKPKFQGGDANDFSKWVNQRLVYPEVAKENGVQGRVMLQFTVKTDGRVSDIKVLSSVDPSLDKEAVRVVSMSPRWTPGKQREGRVKVTYTFPVIFQLR